MNTSKDNKIDWVSLSMLLLSLLGNGSQVYKVVHPSPLQNGQQSEQVIRLVVGKFDFSFKSSSSLSRTVLPQISVD